MTRQNRVGKIEALTLLAVSSCAMVAPTSAAAQTEASAKAPAAESAGRDDGDIIVTAQRRSERAQDVPSSLTVLSAERLQSQGVLSLADYAKQVPTLNIIGSGGAGTGQATLRGVSTGSDRVAGIGIYLDDVPFTPSSARILSTGFTFDPDLADMERIEVLAGPQSTLYGASAMGGLIQYITRQPDLNTAHGSARLFASTVDGGGTGGGVKGSISVPIINDTLALSASAFYRSDPGFVDNIFRNEDNVNRSKVYGGRLALRIKIGEDFETTFIGLVQDITRPGRNTVHLNADFSPTFGRLAYSTPVALPTHIKYRSANARSILDLGGAQITNIASYSNFSGRSVSDFSYLGPLLPLLSGVPGPTTNTVGYDGTPTAKKYTEELRIASSPGRLEWLAGAFITREEGSNPLFMRGRDANGVILPSSSPYFNVYTFASTGSFVEKAAFGDLTFHVTPKLAITGGMRYSSNKQHAVLHTTGLLGVNNAVLGSRENATTYLASITYQPTRELTLYAKAGSAYRPGGSNPLNSQQIAAGVPDSYAADRLWNYEIGVKGSAFDRRLSFAVSAFHMDWTDIQLSQIINGFGAVGNAAGAKIDGVEASLTLTPVNGLQLSANAAYLDTQYTGDVPSANVFAGNRLPFAPKFRGSISMDYSRPVEGRVTPVAGVVFSHQGAQNTPVVNAVTLQLPSYQTLDLRAGIEWSNYRLVARIDNVTDEYGLTSAGQSTGPGRPFVGTVIQPRTFSLALEARF
jgi:outer membrane receptor protein involved in Fe transport